MTALSLEERLRARALRLPADENAAMAEIVATLDDAARAVRAPLPVSAEPAAAMRLPRPPG